MKHTPEVTTALAIVAESLATSIDFKESTSDQKRAVFHYIETWYPKYLGLERDRDKEFIERCIETIRLPWLNEVD